MNKITKGLAATAVTAAMVMPLAANATNGILPFGNGMVAHGFGGAGIGHGAETMSGVDNPALVSRTSNQWAIGASLFSPIRSGDFGGGYVESDNNYFVIPQGGATFSLGKKWDMGVLLTALGGMNTDYDATEINPGLTGRAGFDLSGLLVSVPFSYKIEEKHSLAVSILLGYEMMKTQIPAGFFGANPNWDGSDSATGYGFKLGYAGDIAKGVTLGATYQSKIDMAEMSTFCEPTGDSPIFAGIKAAGNDCSLDMPEQFGLGIAWQINNTWKLVSDIMQVNWSSVDVFGLSPAQGGFGWEDQTIFKIGAEVKSSDKLAWRFGYNYGKSPISEEVIGNNLLAPAITEHHISGGLGQKLGKSSELNYYIGYVPEVEIRDPSDTTGAKMWQWAAGIGYNAKF